MARTVLKRHTLRGTLLANGSASMNAVIRPRGIRPPPSTRRRRVSRPPSMRHRLPIRRRQRRRLHPSFEDHAERSGSGTASGLDGARLLPMCPGIIHERHDADEEACVSRRFRERARQGWRARSLHGRIHGGPENAETRRPPPAAGARPFMNDARCGSADACCSSIDARCDSSFRTTARRGKGGRHCAATAAVWRR